MPTTLTISPAQLSLTEGSSGATYFVYTVDRAGDLAGPTTVDFNVYGEGPGRADAADFVGGTLPSGRLWFGGGESSKQIWVPVAGDAAPESDESFTVALSNPTGATINVQSASGVILTDDGPGPASLAFTESVARPEGNSGSTAFVFTVTRTGDLSGTTTAQWAVEAGGPGGVLEGPATASDFLGGTLPTGTISFAPGQASATITVPVAGDTTPEPSEVFRVRLSNVVGGTGEAVQVGYIGNDDGGALSLTTKSVELNEGTGATTNFVYTVTRSDGATGAASVEWRVWPSGGATATAADFVGGALPSGVLNFADGQTSAQFAVQVAGDNLVESDDTFSVTIFNPVNAYVVGINSSATGTIRNDDIGPASQYQLSGSPVSEGDSGTTPVVYTVTRSGDLSSAVTIGWEVGSGYTGGGSPGHTPSTDVDGKDFAGGVLPSGTVSFAPGQTSATFTVGIAGDAYAEMLDRFYVRLSTGDFINTAIPDDDGPPLSFTSTPVAEGNSGSTPYVITVTRHDDPSLAATASWEVYPPSGGADGADFVGGVLPKGTIQFAAGQTTAQIILDVQGDTAVEGDDAFQLVGFISGNIQPSLTSGIIVNDDGAGPAGQGTAGNDLFTLAPGANLTITGYDQAGQDALIVPMGSTGFSLAGYDGGASLTLVDASAWWNGIAGAQVVRWTGDPTQVDSAAKVDALLQAMPGNSGGGVLFVGDAPGSRIALYYDRNPAQPGGVDLVATFEGLSSATQLNASDFRPGNGGSGAPPSIRPASDTITLPEGSSAGGVAVTLNRSGDLSGASQVGWSVSLVGPSGAEAFASAADFAGGVLPSGVVDFAPGQSTAVINVPVVGDTAPEPLEWFNITLSNPVGASIGYGQVYVGLENDDGTAPPGPTVHTGTVQTATTGDDVFMLSSGAILVRGFDVSGADALGVPTGAGGFALAGYAGQGELTLVDAAAWWSNISGAQVVRWVGDPAAVDTAAEVDALLEAMPGNGGGGRLFVGGASSGKVGIYYDPDPTTRGDTSFVAVIDNLTSASALGSGDFLPF